MHPHAMNTSRPVAQALLACLGEESRFRLVQALIGGARCVTDLAAEVGLSQSCTTRHLQSLERRRLVSGRRDGKRVFYRIREDDPGLLPLLGWALAEAKGAAAVSARHTGSGAQRGPDPARLEPSSGPPGRDPGATDGVAQRSARSKSLLGSQAPGADPLPQSPPSASLGPVRRVGGSDIEDYLL